jgi:hypothetical protein
MAMAVTVFVFSFTPCFSGFKPENEACQTNKQHQ